MPDANHLLFERAFNGIPLFKNQLDLVQQLLSTPPYFVSSKEPEELSKAQSRLKTYVSQLLSESVTRTVTEDFRISLLILLKKKISDETLRKETIDEIFEDLRAKNTPGLKSEVKYWARSSIHNEIAAANYVSIITANPISVETPVQSEHEFSLRKLFIEDLITNICTRETPLKKYRFNFPLETHCEIFWLAFENTLVSYLDKLIDDKNFIEILYEKLAIKATIQSLIEKYQSEKEPREEQETLRVQLLFSLADNIIELLNRNNLVTTFQVSEPIYSVPTIVVNPSELGAGKMYLLVEDEFKRMHIIKTTRENLLLWTLFVWDRIKASKLSKNIPYRLLKSKT